MSTKNYITINRGYLLKKLFIKKNQARMILQIDTQTNTVCSKWYSIELIRQKTSYDAESIKKAIAEKTELGGYAWVEWNNK